MTAWSFAPWLIALLAALGLGTFGWFTRHHQDTDQPTEPEPVPYPDDH